VVSIVAAPAVAAGEADLRIDLGVALRHFDYREFSTSDRLLDRERGIIPGVFFELSSVRGRLRGGVSLARFSGEVDYTGQTNLGLPVSTVTAERMVTLRPWLGWDSEYGGTALQPYVGLGAHRWERDIRPTVLANGTPVSGLFEVYAWQTLDAGVKLRVLAGERSEGWFHATVFRVLDPQLRLRFSSGQDEARLYLGERSGFRLGVLGHYALDKRLRLQWDIGVEKWAFGRSAPVPLTTGNGSITVGTVTEPRSETRSIDLALGLATSF